MTRIKRGVTTKKRHKRLLKRTKGYWGQRRNVFRRAKETSTSCNGICYQGP